MLPQLCRSGEHVSSCRPSSLAPLLPISSTSFHLDTTVPSATPYLAFLNSICLSVFSCSGCFTDMPRSHWPHACPTARSNKTWSHNLRPLTRSLSLDFVVRSRRYRYTHPLGRVYPFRTLARDHFPSSTLTFQFRSWSSTLVRNFGILQFRFRNHRPSDLGHSLVSDALPSIPYTNGSLLTSDRIAIACLFPFCLRLLSCGPIAFRYGVRGAQRFMTIATTGITILCRNRDLRHGAKSQPQHRQSRLKLIPDSSLAACTDHPLVRRSPFCLH